MSKADYLAGKKTSPAELSAWCQAAMIKSGVKEEDSATAADVFVSADTRGVFSHGSRQIFPLMKNVKDGRIKADAAPSVLRENASTAIMDGNCAMPTSIAVKAMDFAIEKAQKTGMAYIGVKNSNHIGALGYYSLMAAEKGLIGLAMTNTNPWMTVPGGSRPVMGTNPIAYAIPNGSERPIFMDIATSSVAVTPILALKAQGKKLPEKWLVDESGRPTDDPSDFPEKSALLPMAMHKGYGLALFVETLCAALTGAAFLSGISDWLSDSAPPAGQGQAFIALDVAALMPREEFFASLRKMTDEIKNAPKAAGAEKIFLPGDIEHEKRDKAFAEGLYLPDYVLANLLSLAESVGDVKGLDSLFG
ncbi:MAG: Ldh family oxidoreductase [Spirochaetes bacterium]|nr:Ldh family oxidoreductase [Spirochaetota bacterium]